MRVSRSSTFFPAMIALAAMTGGAHAALVISKAPTSNVDCSGRICTATAANAVLNVKDLKILLSQADARVVSGAQAQDIIFGAQMQWAKKNRLTLDAYRSIIFKFAVTSEGLGGVTLITNDGGTGGDYSFADKGKLAFWDVKSNLVINGTKFTLVADLPTLINAIGQKPSGAYALAAYYDASVDGQYEQSPIITPLTGTFEGLGHQIDNLNIQDLSYTDLYVGLIREVDPTGVVRDLRLSNARIFGSNLNSVGAIVGWTRGLVENVSVSGIIYGQGAGGVVGWADGGSNLINVESSASVYGASGAGGIAVSTMSVSGCAFDGTVYGSVVGGVTATNYGTISGCHVSGTVTGASASPSGGFQTAGGIAGYMPLGTISNSWVTGDVLDSTFAPGKPAAAKKSKSLAGGIVGWVQAGHIINCYATGRVSAFLYARSWTAGGLVGRMDRHGQITGSYATGTVDSYGDTGGLVGDNAGIISQAYATGAVTTSPGTEFYAGGLVGRESGQTDHAYATGVVSGPTYVGGVLGFDLPTSRGHNADYWDLDTSGVSDPAHGAGFPASDPGLAGLSDTQLKSGLPANFNSSIWGQSASVNNGYPYLLDNPPQ